MTAKNYYTYYDRLFSKKDYGREVDVVLRFAKEHGIKGTAILDVGCGTGSHALEFARRGYSVVGTDTDCGMIAAANEKREQSGEQEKLTFVCGDISDARTGEADIAVSLFHVVNYIQEPDALRAFFRAIHERLRGGGIFVFDCWNGVAAIADTPKEKATSIECEGERIETSMVPDIHLMEQRVVMHDAVRVLRGGAEKALFQFEYAQRLWTPWHLTGILRESGFETVRITSWAEPEKAAAHATWKIVFVCKKEIISQK
ncbi:MAG: class I SAM-dependent methyltransferase [Candidatus Liptonbacteria bacterium]|nr:class I SAM-dependent methyltransferase [Candidatus Liptonbacteria bacterium]